MSIKICNGKYHLDIDAAFSRQHSKSVIYKDYGIQGSCRNNTTNAQCETDCYAGSGTAVGWNGAYASINLAKTAQS